MNSIQLIALNNFPSIKPYDDLVEIIIKSLNSNNISIDDMDVIVVAQKIISKAENRFLDLDNIQVLDEAKKLANDLNKDPGLIQAIIISWHF